MKLLSTLILSLTLFIAPLTITAQSKVAHINTQQLNSGLPEVIAALGGLKKFEDQLNAERIILTPELINDRELEIQDFASDIIRLQEKRFGPNGDMIIQRSKLIQPLQDQVMTIVKQVAEEKKYDFIFDRSSTATMLYSAKNYDISELVIKRINRQQKIQNRKEQIEALKSKTSRLNN